MVTFPDSSFTLHDAHVPDRHALSINTPAWSAASRIVDPARTGTLVSETWNTTKPATSADSPPLTVGSRLTVPNASVLICPAGTPSRARAAVVASIISGGPHTWARQSAMFGTIRESKAASIRPTGPDHASVPGWLIVTITLRLTLPASSFLNSSLKIKSRGARKPSTKYTFPSQLVSVR